MKTQKQTFKFWKENQLDQEFELSLGEIKKKYRKYLKTKEKPWVVRYKRQTVNAFIADKNGLNSVAEPEDYSLLQNELSDVRNEFYK